MKIGAIVQARTSSTRFPEKILKTLPYDSDITVLQQVIRRLKLSHHITEIIIATSTDPSDDAIPPIAKSEGVQYFRGDLHDVLSRFYFAAEKYSLTHIVRVTSDCPCIDPEIIDRVVLKHLETNADYTSNIQTRTFPHGLDTEVIAFQALEQAFSEASSPSDREHVCPYFYKTRPDLFSISSVKTTSSDFFGPDIRITLDTQEDYILLSAIFDYLYKNDPYFRTPMIIKLFENHPWLKLLNKTILQKKVTYSPLDQYNETLKWVKLQGLDIIADNLPYLKARIKKYENQ